MKMKKIAFTLGMAAMVLPTFAQYEKYENDVDFTNDEKRWEIAYIGDELELKGNVTLVR